MEFKGELETHITVSLAAPQTIEQLQEWSRIHGLKCIQIVLDRGETVSQPMVSRRAFSTFSKELKKADELKDILSANGFPVIRIKIEIPPTNEGVPHSQNETKDNANSYFENHIKLLLDTVSDKSGLEKIAERHSAHLSRNALRKRKDGFEERFVTQRCWSVGRIEAFDQFNVLLNELLNSNYTVLETENEYVIYDSNLEIDKGWISAKE